MAQEKELGFFSKLFVLWVGYRAAKWFWQLSDPNRAEN